MGPKCIQPVRKAAIGAAFAAICLLYQPLRAADLSAAEVVSVGGRVSVIRDSMEWALFQGSRVQVGELIVTGEDGFAHLQVADGSSFTVYPNSQVVFRKNPGSLKDLLDLFLGRIKVHIQKLGGGPNQQRVFTPTAVISVRGTIFDVSVDEDETTVVAVDEGLVSVSHRLLPSNTEVDVPAGQSLIIYRNAPLAKAGVDKSKAVAFADEVARTLAYIWNRIGRRSSSSPSGGGAGGGLPGDVPAGGPPLPGDTPAPEPPPAPDN